MAIKEVERSDPRVWRTGIPLYRVRENRPKECVILTNTYFPFLTHFWNGRTVGCPGKENCKACKNREQLRFAATLVVGNRKGVRWHLMPFTNHALTLLFEQLGIENLDEQRKADLRGIILHVRRETIDVRSRLLATLIGREDSISGKDGLPPYDKLVEWTRNIFWSSDILNRDLPA